MLLTAGSGHLIEGKITIDDLPMDCVVASKNTHQFFNRMEQASVIQTPSYQVMEDVGDHADGTAVQEPLEKASTVDSDDAVEATIMSAETAQETVIEGDVTVRYS